jgi:hypothetical protein
MIDATGTTERWKRFVTVFLVALGGSVACVYLFILLVDPYGIIPFSLPFDRRIVSISQAFVYPQIVLSKKYDSLLVGTSTSRLLDPAYLSDRFNVRLANLAMNSMLAWEQKEMIDYFGRRIGHPKLLIVGIDGVWCYENADKVRHNPYGWPEWIYDDNPLNDYLYLFNEPTAEIAVRLVGFKLGLYPERVRFDGFEVFTPPEKSYDPDRARQHIWQNSSPKTSINLTPPILSTDEKASLPFPALNWLSEILQNLPRSTVKILAFMPVHIAEQPWPGTKAAAVEAECKAQIVEIARESGAKVVDWRIHSPITREDTNYWDQLHYRLPIAQRIQQELADAVLGDRDSHDGSYHILAH